MEDDAVELRPSPWTAHVWVMGCVVALYAGFALAAWPGANAMARLVIAVWGAGVAMLVLVATALVAVFRRSAAPLVTAYGVAIGAVVVLLAMWLGGGG